MKTTAPGSLRLYQAADGCLYGLDIVSMTDDNGVQTYLLYDGPGRRRA
jgi:hypothetical protein